MKQPLWYRVSLTLISITFLFLLYALFFIVPAQAQGFSQYDEYFTLTCKNETEVYFIKPSTITAVLIGVKDEFCCFYATDTNNKERFLCNIPFSKDTCVGNLSLEI